MSEFAIIQKYCQGIGQSHPETRLSVGDDAALISVPTGYELAISVDTMVSGVHFFPQTSARLLARKLLSVNLSDMAAMGAQPQWATLALTLPAPDERWLKEFSTALSEQANHYGVELIGGDTTQGPLTLSLQIMGLVAGGKALQRRSAKVGDEVFISNTVGDAALALRLIKAEDSVESDVLLNLRAALDDPTPQLDLGYRLVDVASAAIDISDGLVADLTHIAQASEVDIEIDIDRIPTSTLFQSAGGNINDALYGGDDYQLAFTVPKDKVDVLSELGRDLNITLTRIGEVLQRGDKVILTQSGREIAIRPDKGYQHFSNQSQADQI